MIEFSEDQKTVTVSADLFNEMVCKLSRKSPLEENLIHAHIIIHSELYDPEQVALSTEAFDHGIRQFIYDLHMYVLAVKEQAK